MSIISQITQPEQDPKTSSTSVLNTVQEDAEALAWLQDVVSDPEDTETGLSMFHDEIDDSDGMEYLVLITVQGAVNKGYTGLQSRIEALEAHHLANDGAKGDVARWVIEAAHSTIIRYDISDKLMGEGHRSPVEDPGAEFTPVAKLSQEDKRAEAVRAVEAKQAKDFDPWGSYPNLAEIDKIAERAGQDRYSVLFRTLTYLSAQMPPETYLENFHQPLTLYSVVIAESGSGKGYLDMVADNLVGQRELKGLSQLRPGNGNMHTLLTEFGDFDNLEEDKEGNKITPRPQRMLIQGNELASWAEMQGNAQWSGILADVFDGKGDYEVRAQNNSYHFGVEEHSLGVTFSVQPDAARYLFDSTGRGLPGRCLISALPPSNETLPEDFDPWSDGSDIDTFDPARDVTPLDINPRYFNLGTPFRLSAKTEKANANLKKAWDLNHGEAGQLRSEKIFSQMPKVRLRVAVMLAVLLDLAPDHEVPIEALKLADFFLKISVENTRYAQSLGVKAERKGNAEVSASRKRADHDAQMQLAEEDVLAVIDSSPTKRAGLGLMANRKKRTAEFHEEAAERLEGRGVIKKHHNPANGTHSYCRV